MVLIIYILNTCLPSVKVVFALKVVSPFEQNRNFERGVSVGTKTSTKKM